MTEFSGLPVEPLSDEDRIRDAQIFAEALRIVVPVVHETCDYCGREFSHAAGSPAICLSCGLENIRERILLGESPISVARKAIREATITVLKSAESTAMPTLHVQSPDPPKKPKKNRRGR